MVCEIHIFLSIVAPVILLYAVLEWNVINSNCIQNANKNCRYLFYLSLYIIFYQVKIW